MASPLAERSEAQASGEQRRIFGEIRRLSGVPMVALIYRHLATIPGALEWAWGLLGPALESGQIQQRAWALAELHRVDAEAALPAAAMLQAGIDAAQLADVQDVLAAYNRANPVNGLFVACLAQHLQGCAATDAVTVVADWCPPPPLPALPALVELADMTPELRATVLLLTTHDPAAPPPALWPSLYRHLAHWPQVLACAARLVAPRFATIDVQARRLRAQLQTAAQQLAPGLRAAPGLVPPVGADRLALLDAVKGFGERIPEMVLIGGLLARAMPLLPPPLPDGA